MNTITGLKTGTLRERQKKETRALILDSARTIFSRNGFEDAKTRDMAHHAGIGIGTIFNYFPTKRTLLLASFLDDINRVKVHALKKLLSDTPIKEKLLYLAKSFYEYYAQNPALSRTLIKESMFVTEKGGEKGTQDIVNFIELIIQMLEKAKDNGELRPNANCQLVARSFFANYLFILIMALHEGDIKAVELSSQLKQMLDQLWEGIGSV